MNCFLFSPDRYCLVRRLFFILIYVDVTCSPLILCDTLMDEVIGKALRLFLQCGTWLDLFSPWTKQGPFMGMPIILSLYLKPGRYSQHCFIATNSEPRENVSTLVCFLLQKCTNKEFIHTRYLVLELLLMESMA